MLALKRAATGWFGVQIKLKSEVLEKMKFVRPTK